MTIPVTAGEQGSRYWRSPAARLANQMRCVMTQDQSARRPFPARSRISRFVGTLRLTRMNDDMWVATLYTTVSIDNRLFQLATEYSARV